MRVILAIIIPPLAILSCGKVFQCLINLVFWIASIPLAFVFGIGIFVWLLCVVHALTVYSSCERNKQMDRLVNAIQQRP